MVRWDTAGRHLGLPTEPTGLSMQSRLPLYFAAAILAALSALATRASAADWLTAPSTYTHDPTTAQRVTQYTPIGPYYYYARPDYLKSGYRNLRSTIDLGNSSDNLVITEEWG